MRRILRRLGTTWLRISPELQVDQTKKEKNTKTTQEAENVENCYKMTILIDAYDGSGMFGIFGMMRLCSVIWDVLYMSLCELADFVSHDGHNESAEHECAVLICSHCSSDMSSVI
jgi:hypothetical protein